MILWKNRRVNTWLVVTVAAVLWAISLGFDHGLSASNEEIYPSLKIFAEVIDLIERNYVDPVETKELIENAIQGMVRGLDPHSAFLPKEDFNELQVDTQGEFTGIGIQIAIRDGLVTVISPIEGTPAYEAGIRSGDKIVEVDGVAIRDLHEAVKKMRGPKGTPVTVTALREGVAEPMEFSLVRDKIPIKSIKYSVLSPGYGFVRVTNFNVNTAEDLREALGDLESREDSLKGLVLDIRNNPGGLLDQAVEVSDIFLDQGEIVSMRGRQKTNSRVFRAHADDVQRDYPIVALINGASASASEIVAGALQDNKRAVILGTTSFGKGSVQSVETLRDGTGLKLTIARYYTPNGHSIQAQGIKPDVVVERRFLEEEEEERRQPLKEKDLRNHLDARPLDGTIQESEEEGGNGVEEEPEADFPESVVDPLSSERLLRDDQIKRALEILTSYQLLKDMPS